jgi:endo-1,4-beta-xylanase
MVLPEPNVKAVLTWGITDAHSWLNESKQPSAQRADGGLQRPLPLDKDYQPTPAFYAIRAALDASRQPVATGDILSRPAGNKGTGADPFAPFAVPGSPTVGPKP